MLFNSYVYIFLFLPMVLVVYFYLINIKLTEGAKAILVLASLTFYSWWNVSYLPIILFSMLMNYSIGRSFKSDKNISNKILLIFGVTINLIMLGYFKYTSFLIDNVNFFTDFSIPTLELALPLAISFFTFQQIAYLVDSYNGETAEYDFLNYSLFVTFFPQLIAGPIVHHNEMMPQFSSIRSKIKNYRNLLLGLFIFSIGLFKKVVIADTFSIWANDGFDKLEVLTFFEAWGSSLSYTFQLYFDFSGYTDMAIGAALLFNIRLPINFNSPYKALNIQDFWRRWHITLSRFLKDYVYIPLGGNKNGNYKMYTNLLATFLIGGIWHGAGWTFVIWGAIHGIAVIIHRKWKEFGFTMQRFLAWFITFNFINLSWIFFRSNDIDTAFKVFSGLVSTDMTISSLANIIFILFGFIVIFLKNTSEIANNIQFSTKNIFYYSFIFAISLIFLENQKVFLYYDF